MKHRLIGIILTALSISDFTVSQQRGQTVYPAEPLTVFLSSAAVSQMENGLPVLFESGRSSSIPFSADRIVFAGLSTLQKWSMEFSLSRNDTDWSPWEPVAIHWYPDNKFWVRMMIPEEYRGGVIRYRISDAGIESDVKIEFFSIEFISSQKIEEVIFSESGPQLAAAIDSLLLPPIISRAAWSAKPTAGVLVPHIPYRASIHNTLMSRITSLEAGIQEMHCIQDLHMIANGWKDVGYHYCIDDSGRIYEGTPVQYIASHTDNNNSRNIGISFMGNFGGTAPTQLMLQSCAELLAALAITFPLKADSIFGHRDYDPLTECPGNAAHALLPDIRNRVRLKLAQGAPYIKNPSPLPFGKGIDPAAPIVFQLRDDLEGIRKDSLIVLVNNIAVQPLVQSIDSNEITVAYTPPFSFPYSSRVTVEIRAQDRGVPPAKMIYRFQFSIKAQAIPIEMLSEQTLSNAQWTKTGSWTISPSDVSLPELTDGFMMSARDSMQDHSVIIYPEVKESGNYFVYVALPGQVLGLNARYVVKNSLGIIKEEFVEYNRTFSLVWGQLGTSAVYFSAGSPSTASIQLQPMPGFTTMMWLDAIKLEKKDPQIPPAIPELKSVRETSQGKIEIQWYPSLEGGLRGYRIMKSTDGYSWLDTLANESLLGPRDTSFSFSPPAGKGILYFQIFAVDTQRTINTDGRPDYVVSPSGLMLCKFPLS